MGYGYFGRSRNCYVRHCFFINKSGEVIDPSIFFGMENLEMTYSFLEY